MAIIEIKDNDGKTIVTYDSNLYPNHGVVGAHIVSELDELVMNQCRANNVVSSAINKPEEKAIMYVGVSKDIKSDVENRYFDYTGSLGPLVEAELFTEAYIAHTKVCPNCAEDMPKNLEFVPVEVKLIK